MKNFSEWLLAALRNQLTKIKPNKVPVAEDAVFINNGARYGLSARQLEVVRLMLKGRTYAQIAAELYISRKTVDTHVQHIYAKLGVRNKLELLNKLSR